VFHKICIDPWLLKESRKCPNCKGRVVFPNERFSYSSDESGESDSGDERTPLLRHSRRRPSDENYRFVETLTESHNSRALSNQLTAEQYDEIPGTSAISSVPPVGAFSPASKPRGPRSSNVPKVTFAPTHYRDNGGGGSNSTAVPSKAFVLPGTPRSRGTKKSERPPGPSSSASGTPGVTKVAIERQDLSSSGSSTASDGTLLEFHDVETTPYPVTTSSSSLSDSTEVNSLSSYHSCQGFTESDQTGDGIQQELFESLSSNTSS
jgi:hypothetical protein